MNTAARLPNQTVLPRPLVLSRVVEKAQLTLLTMVMSVLLTGLSVIYMTNTTRNLTASLQQTFAEREHLHVQWEQLLLEKSTWIMQARIQNLAEGKLDMVIPDNKSVVVVNE
ncbi:MAG TPA: cell division protein FtsL [Gammaproteobacteria bacterium]|nr:cell division protein FtsL [Gammaproteobacteria bacterium]